MKVFTWKNRWKLRKALHSVAGNMDEIRTRNLMVISTVEKSHLLELVVSVRRHSSALTHQNKADAYLKSLSDYYELHLTSVFRPFKVLLPVSWIWNNTVKTKVHVLYQRMVSPRKQGLP
jgi:hypothetical protein